jgi:hypothetical protein
MENDEINKWKYDINNNNIDNVNIFNFSPSAGNNITYYYLL